MKKAFLKINGVRLTVAALLTVLTVLSMASCATEKNAIGIIGGADGPTEIYVSKPNNGNSDKNANVGGTNNSQQNSENANMLNTEIKTDEEKSQNDPLIVKLYAAGILQYIGKGSMHIAINIAMYVLCALIAYSLGSLNFGIIISKLIYHDDVRTHGSGNAGTTNMLRTYGKGAAAATIIGDALKVVLAIVIANFLVGSLYYGGYVAGFFAILGHVYPIYYGFKGGKGVVASAITILMLEPKVFLIVFAVFIAVVAIWRYISLGSIIAAAVYPLITYCYAMASRGGSGLDVVFAFLIAAFVIVLHRTNIQRLLEGKENKLSFKSKSSKSQNNSEK